MSSKRRDIYQEVTDRIVTALEAGTVHWVRPWSGGGSGMPRSVATGKDYSGVNVLLLWIMQAQEGYALAGDAKKGPKGPFKPLVESSNLAALTISSALSRWKQHPPR